MSECSSLESASSIGTRLEYSLHSTNYCTLWLRRESWNLLSRPAWLYEPVGHVWRGSLRFQMTSCTARNKSDIEQICSLAQTMPKPDFFASIRYRPHSLGAHRPAKLRTSLSGYLKSGSRKCFSSRSEIPSHLPITNEKASWCRDFINTKREQFCS